MVEEGAIPDPRPFPWESFQEEPSEWDAARAQDATQQPSAGLQKPSGLAECQAPTTRWIADADGKYDDPAFISA